MHYLVSFTWLFDLRYWRLLPLVCRHHSKNLPSERLHLVRGQGWTGFSLLVQFGHIFERLSQISYSEVSVAPKCDSTKLIPLSKTFVPLGGLGESLKKIERGVNFAWQPGEVHVCQNAAFSPPLPCNVVRKFESLVKETACCAHRAFTRGLFAPVLTR